MITVNTHEAKTRLSALLVAVQERGETVLDLPQWQTGRRTQAAIIPGNRAAVASAAGSRLGRTYPLRSHRTSQ